MLNNFFAKNLRYLRLKNNVSQDELAFELGYKSYTTIQKWETGQNEPNMAVLNKLADKWNVSLDDLVKVDLESLRYFDSKASSSSIIDSKITRLTVYGKVCAVNGKEAFEDPIDEITNPYHRIKGELFALQVDGDSMDKIVTNGDYAIIQKQPIVKNGEIAVVLIDRDLAMIKRFYQVDSETVMLKPESNNLQHKPLIFIGSEINSLKILGRYIGAVKPMERLL